MKQEPAESSPPSVIPGVTNAAASSSRDHVKREVKEEDLNDPDFASLRDQAVAATHVVPPHIYRALQSAADAWYDNEIAYLNSMGTPAVGAAGQQLRELSRGHLRAMMRRCATVLLESIVENEGLALPSLADHPDEAVREAYM